MALVSRSPGQTNSTLGWELYSKCVQLVNENKVSVKNAFDLHLIDHMDDIVDSFMGGRKRAAPGTPSGTPRKARQRDQEEVEAEHRFHEASCTVEASAKIYACRVDCVHTDTYRVLGGLSSADMGDDDEGEQGGEQGAAKRRRRMCGVNTLERNEANIILQHLEADEQSDPMFRRMAAAFDAGGAAGLLLNKLHVAEDMSLIFNGDVPLTRAAQLAPPLFTKERPDVSASALGLGDPSAAASCIGEARVCPDVEQFRKMLYGNAKPEAPLPIALEELLAITDPATASDKPADVPGMSQALVPMEGGSEAPVISEVLVPVADGSMTEGTGSAVLASQDLVPATPQVLAPTVPHKVEKDEKVEPADGTSTPTATGIGESQGLSPLPFADKEASQAKAETIVDIVQSIPSNSAIAFDELFEKFCSGPVLQQQFAYVDQELARPPDTHEAEAAAAEATAATASADFSNMEGFIDDAGAALVLLPDDETPSAQPSQREKRKPVVDLVGDDFNKGGVKPIETEPAHKHQLSEKAVHWQLNKDVPPFMTNRITMPSWPQWSKCDFACIGLRRHLMLKLQRMSDPPGDGPHSFSDLYSTVVVHNPDVFPWNTGKVKVTPNRRDDELRDARRGGESGLDDAGAEEVIDASGLPVHLDLDPQDLFVGPDDVVVPDIEEAEDAGHEQGGQAVVAVSPGGSPGGPAAANGNSSANDLSLGTGTADAGQGIASKFVDVKRVKKHLWDCISDDLADARAMRRQSTDAEISFQGLVDRTVKRLPRGEVENLSPAVCFICALHLCNEKTLELMPNESEPLGDFKVVGPPS
mmetsp:Transcript_123898/g.246613  ORF Transcript_123898/g.246613 Transcript_123898/m.246613 type:complete len:814 (-) Transcript_123898:98-2539(-)